MNIITAGKLYWKFRPLIDQFVQLTGMKFSAQVAVSMALIVLQGCTQVSDFVPPKYKVIAIFAHVIIEAILKIVANLTNPDGTPVHLPWIPKGYEAVQKEE